MFSKVRQSFDVNEMVKAILECPGDINEGWRKPRREISRRFLGGSGGMLPREILKSRVSEMPFPALWGNLIEGI